VSTISLENRIEIYELIAKYAHFCDAYESEQWADLFVADGQLVSGATVLAGREVLINRVEELRRNDDGLRHDIANIYLEPGMTDEHATAKAYGIVTSWAKSPPEMTIFADYSFELVNREGEWKIKLLNVLRPHEP